MYNASPVSSVHLTNDRGIPLHVADYMRDHTIAAMKYFIGGFSHPKKMPEAGYSLPAYACNVGQKLRTKKNTVCSRCYGCGGNYCFPNVAACLFDRLYTVANTDPRDWVLSASGLIWHYGIDYFRWHDSGDLQSFNHLMRIIRVCENTPNTRHWLPTKEIGILREYLNSSRCQWEGIPENLCIRVSAYYINRDAPDLGVPTSVVLSDKHPGADAQPKADACPVTTGAAESCNEADCRKCWDTETPCVGYKLHR